MLQTDQIPRKEPVIRVGIVLPEDKQKTLNISSTTPFRISTGKSGSSQTSKSLSITVDNNQLVIVPNSGFAQTNELEIELTDVNDNFVISQVRAGRSFHWEKNIEVKLTHKLLIKCIEKCMLLINELPLEQYLACVATSEMSAACPATFLEAQTIVARSWMLANVEQKHRHLGFDVCNDDCCQRFQGINDLSSDAVEKSNRTRGKVLMYENEICDARYSKSCGGVMERFENLWEDTPLPYMQNLKDAPGQEKPDLTDEKIFKAWLYSNPETYCSPHYIPENELGKYLGKVDENGQYFRWKKSVSQEQICLNINKKMGIDALAITKLTTISRGGSGRMLKLKISYLDQQKIEKTQIIFKDYQIRNILHPGFLYSSACIIEKKETSKKYPDFEYTGAGWGHGAGLCQIGALGMSLAGLRTEDILSHYYPGSKLVKIYT